MNFHTNPSGKEKGREPEGCGQKEINMLNVAHLRQQKRDNRSPAHQALTDDEATEKQFAALVAAWNRAGEAARHRFCEEVIDAPVFERSAA